MHSWPLDCPFSIIHVDLWQPGDSKDKEKHRYLFNAMCDMTQFVITIPTKDSHAHTLARLFMQDVLLKVGFCSTVVVDDGNSFKETFKTMCEILNIRYHLLAKGNHQALSVERFHRYLNKAVTIAANDRDSNTEFVPAACTAAYAWNSSPIDGTDIIRSIPAVGQEFKFPFDFHYSDIPQLTTDHASVIRDYLSCTAANAAFATAILKILLEDRCTSHCERVNSTHTQPTFQLGDIVTARVQVRSTSSTGTVGKLSYQSRGPFKITQKTDNGAYLVQKLDKSEDSPTSKFHGSDLYLLPPALESRYLVPRLRQFL